MARKRKKEQKALVLDFAYFLFQHVSLTLLGLRRACTWTHRRLATKHKKTFSDAYLICPRLLLYNSSLSGNN